MFSLRNIMLIKGLTFQKPKGMSLTQEESRRDGRAEETLTLSLFPVREKY